MTLTTTSPIVQEAQRTILLRLTERHGVNHELRRDVWINPAQVTRFHEISSVVQGRVTMVRFAPGDCVWVEESPELVAAELGWS